MTITDIELIRTRHRTPRPEPEATPQSQRAESLWAVLDDPNLSGYHEQARAELAELTATSVLAA